jgi:cysteine synthase
MSLASLGEQLGPTPLVPIRLREGEPTIWCKLEFLNPSGSTKDRIAAYMLRKAWEAGKLHRGQAVIEASSGSTSIALAAACAQLGLSFTAVLAPGGASERVMMIRAYGGQIVYCPAGQGIAGAIAHAEKLGQDVTDKLLEVREQKRLARKCRSERSNQARSNRKSSALNVVPWQLNTLAESPKTR